MPAVCIAFSIHQPYRLRRYSIFDASPKYVDDAATTEAVQHAAKNCYLPVLKALVSLARNNPRFRVAVSITGTAVELFERHAPEVTHHLHALHATQCVEFLGETYYGSLSSVYSRAEFIEQVRQQGQMIKRLFGTKPKVFRNTEMVYCNDVARCVAEVGFDAVLVEGVEAILASRSPAFVHSAMGFPQVRLLLRNRALSDAIGRHFADPASALFPLTDEKLAAAIKEIGGHLCNLYFDMESFGLWQPRETGVLAFLSSLPARLGSMHCDLVTPSEAIARFATAGELDVPHITSWCDGDSAAWLGNAMQKNAQEDLYKVETAVKATGNRALLADFRGLTSADHAWFMSTRFAPGTATGTVSCEAPRRESPYESPYDAYINFMNVLDNVKARARA